ncbi:MAG: hypothetical protein JWR09_700 [Mucilaginibacter sp.]|nr:hypothetical protein [Mucilaginibacter sp.]
MLFNRGHFLSNLYAILAQYNMPNKKKITYSIKTLSLIFFMLIIGLKHSTAQIVPSYDGDPEIQRFINKGDSLFFAAEYDKSALNYKQATKGKYDETIYLNMCRAYLKLKDRANFISTLKILADSGFKGYWIFDEEPDFKEQERYKTVQPVQKKIQDNYQKYANALHLKYPDIAAKLFRMSYEDQRYQNMHRFKSRYPNAYKDYMSANLTDSAKKIFVKNGSLLKEIVDRLGFLGYREVGKDGAKVSWLVVQHCDFDPAFQKKYLSLMKVAVGNNNANNTDFAYLVDRVRKGSGEKQVYGTQLVYTMEEDSLTHQKKVKISLWPVENELKLNDLRKEVGLSSIEEYLELVKKTNNP